MYSSSILPLIGLGIREEVYRFQRAWRMACVVILAGALARQQGPRATDRWDGNGIKFVAKKMRRIRTAACWIG